MSEKIVCIALGNAGIKILDRFASMILPTHPYTLLAIDSDQRTLDAIKSPLITRIAAGLNWTSGVGTGGDRVKGERCGAEGLKELLPFTEKAKALIWIGGIGGGMASGAMTALQRSFLNAQFPQLFLTTTPFYFEGKNRFENALRAKNELSKSGVILTISNDLLLSSLPNDVSAKEAFNAADKALSQTLYGLAQTFVATPLLSDGYSSIKYLLEGKTAHAAIGIATALGTTPAERIQETLVKLPLSPLLGGMRFLKEADATIHIVTAGSDLSIGEMRKALDNLKGLYSPEVKSVIAVNIDPMLKETVQLTIIALKYDKNPFVKTNEDHEPTALMRTQNKLRARAKEKPVFTGDDDQLRQPLLPIQDFSRGIFTHTNIFKVDGQDLDIPAFQRNNLHTR